MMQAEPLEAGYSPLRGPRAWCNVGDPSTEAQANGNETGDTLGR